MPSCTCFGACGGVAGWKDPATGLVCNVCMGSGTYTSYDQRELDAKEWEKIRAAQIARAEKKRRVA